MVSNPQRVSENPGRRAGRLSALVLCLAGHDPLGAVRVLGELAVEVTQATDLPSAEQILRDEPPDVVLLLDVGSDDARADSLAPAACRQLLAASSVSHGASPPIVGIHEGFDEQRIVRGLEAGMSDYICGPYLRPAIVLYRLLALIRLAAGDDASVDEHTLRFGSLTVLTDRYEVLVRGEPVDLTTTEFRMLKLLLRRPGWVFSREQIAESLFTQEGNVAPSTIKTHLSNLRRKLGEMGPAIETVRGVGYRFRRI